MVRKVIRIGLHEISTIDVICQYCETRVQFHLDKETRAEACPACEENYPEGVYRGINRLRAAFGHFRQDKEKTTAFEIELKD